MVVRAECDGTDCQENILEETGFQLIEGEVIVMDGSEVVEQNDYHGTFCSIDCLREYLRGVSE